MLIVNKGAFNEVKKAVGFSRSGFLNTRLGAVETPFFMPVATMGAVKGLNTDQVAATGAKVLLSNTYHLHLQPGEKIVNKLGGLHEFSGWQGPTLTDSGGFQVFSLAKIRKITEEGVKFKNLSSGDEVFLTPEKSIQIQLLLGSDIILAFDDLTGLSLKDRPRSREAVERTHRWLKRSLDEFERLTKNLKNDQRPLLFGIVQGGLDKELRYKSLDFVQSQPVDGIAIGGLAVGEERREMYGMLDLLASKYDSTRVHYLMGVGAPVDIRYAIEKGIDMFDSVMPTRNARHGSVWISGDKKLNLNNLQFANDPTPIDKNCDCYTCKSGISRAFLRQMFKTGNALGGSLSSIHNLRYVQEICESYR
jgi:queuine tRNA-ribosyltransferase